MTIHQKSLLATEIRKLKNKGMTDREIAEQLDMKPARVHYIRSLYGIGGRYELASRALGHS